MNSLDMVISFSSSAAKCQSFSCVGVEQTNFTIFVLKNSKFFTYQVRFCNVRVYSVDWNMFFKTNQVNLLERKVCDRTKAVGIQNDNKYLEQDALVGNINN